MYRIIELTLHKDMMALFGFLKNNPSRVLRNGVYYKFLYYEPFDEHFMPFTYRLIALKIIDYDPTEKLFSEGWEIVRNLGIKIAGQQLITELRDLESDNIHNSISGDGLMLKDWVFDVVTIGIFTRRETALFIKIMRLSGYDFEQTIALFSSVVRNKALSRYFVELAVNLYKGE